MEGPEPWSLFFLVLAEACEFLYLIACGTAPPSPPVLGGSVWRAAGIFVRPGVFYIDFHKNGAIYNIVPLPDDERQLGQILRRRALNDLQLS